MIATTCEPTFWPTSASPKPLTTAVVAKLVGPAFVQDWSKTVLLRQRTPWYCTVTVSPLVTVSPVPTSRSAIFSVVGAAVFGTVTVGCPFPASVTFGKPDGGVFTAPVAFVG